MMLAEESVAFQAGHDIGKALFFLAVVAVLSWRLYRWRHRR
jgi:hypothetical protein